LVVAHYRLSYDQGLGGNPPPHFLHSHELPKTVSALPSTKQLGVVLGISCLKDLASIPAAFWAGHTGTSNDVIQ
jgi:hypothetical protein